MANMMKRNILLLMLCMAVSAAAQHYVGFSASGAAAWQLDKLDFTNMRTGGGGAIGAVYEFQHNYFILQTGIEAAAGLTSQGIADRTLTSSTLTDEYGEDFYYQGYVTNRIDRATSVEVQVPLLAGFEMRYFYVLAGVRFAANVYGVGTSTAMYAVERKYLSSFQFEYVPLPPVPEERRGSYPMTFRPDLRLGGELGTVFMVGGGRNYNDKPTKIRLGLYAEYGVLNVLNASEDMSMTSATVEQFENRHVTMVHAHLAKESLPSPLHNLRAGIKLTVLFPLTEDQNRKNQRSGARRWCTCSGD